jgi:hypothetical protein
MIGNPALVSNKKGALYLRDKLLGFVIIKDRRTGNFVTVTTATLSLKKWCA